MFYISLCCMDMDTDMHVSNTTQYGHDDAFFRKYSTRIRLEPILPLYLYFFYLLIKLILFEVLNFVHEIF